MFLTFRVSFSLMGAMLMREKIKSSPICTWWKWCYRKWHLMLPQPEHQTWCRNYFRCYFTICTLAQLITPLPYQMKSNIGWYKSTMQMHIKSHCPEIAMDQTIPTITTEVRIKITGMVAKTTAPLSSITACKVTYFSKTKTDYFSMTKHRSWQNGFLHHSDKTSSYKLINQFWQLYFL